MRIGYTHADLYDRESDYWQDIENAQQAQLETQKNLSKAATYDKNLNNKPNKNISQEDM